MSKKIMRALVIFSVTFFFGSSLVFAFVSGPSKDWSEDELKEFIGKPWTEAELKAMGDNAYVLDKNVIQPHVDKPTTPQQLYQNGKNVWMPIMFQYGRGINSKEFKTLWIDEEKWKDPKHVLLDLRMESEFDQGRIPGAIRVDTGLAYWFLPKFAPDPTATYYLQCKSGTPSDGGIRGAFVKKYMIDMGYSGDIYNITDGFRGWLENGYPIVNRHGLFTLVPGAFQKPDPYKKK